MEPYLLYCMAFLYVAAGVLHFLKPRFYERIVPPFFPAAWVRPIVWISGLAEVLLGLLLLPEPSRPYAAWGIIALLVAVFPANIYHYTSGGAGMKIPGWALMLRLPVQGVLVYWAWIYTQG